MYICVCVKNTVFHCFYAWTRNILFFLFLGSTFTVFSDSATTVGSQYVVSQQTDSVGCPRGRRDQETLLSGANSLYCSYRKHHHERESSMAANMGMMGDMVSTHFVAFLHDFSSGTDMTTGEEDDSVKDYLAQVKP